MSRATMTRPSAWRQRLEVARWEFQRFVKPKQMLISLVLTIVAGGLGYFMAWVGERNARAEVDVAVVGLAPGQTLPESVPDGVQFTAHPRESLSALLGQVRARELEAVLEVTGAEAATLHVRRERPWRGAVERQWSMARQADRLAASGVTPQQLAALGAPAPVTVRTTDADRGGRSARLAAMVAAGAVVYGIFIAIAFMFVSVTGEKTQRITETLIATVRPQDWIDGKILGVAAASVVNLVVLAVGVLVFYVGRAVARGSWQAPRVAGDPASLLLILAFAVLGYAFWLAFFGGVAATIDDPNSSTRGPVMFIPILFQLSGFVIAGNPDSLAARVMSIVPLTASGTMCVRLGMTDVPWWELLLAAACLVGGTLAMRRAAGKVFALGVLMTGKEPSWGEMRRWIREA